MNSKSPLRNRRARMAQFVMSVAVITIGTIGAAIALNPAAPQQQAAQSAANVTAPVTSDAKRAQPRLINIMGHDNCAFVEVRRSDDGRADQVRCLRKL